MSTIFPELARQLEHAADRHHRHGNGWRRVRWAIPALVAAAVCVAIVVTVIPPGDDEQPVPGHRSAGPEDPLTDAYAIFRDSGPTLEPALQRHLALEMNFAKRPPPVIRRAGVDGSEQIVLVAGRNKSSGDRVVCVFRVQARGAGGVCMRQAKLLASDRPWFIDIPDGPVILARNDITRIRLHLADGSTRDLIPRNNIAIGRGDIACAIEWRRVDGSRDTAPVDGTPSERCG